MAASTTPPPGKAQNVQGVYILRNDRKKLRVIFVPVTTGVTGATDIEVMNGLKESDQIVTGTYQVIRTIKNETQVKVDNKAPVQTKT